MQVRITRSAESASSRACINVRSSGRCQQSLRCAICTRPPCQGFAGCLSRHKVKLKFKCRQEITMLCCCVKACSAYKHALARPGPFMAIRSSHWLAGTVEFGYCEEAHQTHLWQRQLTRNLNIFACNSRYSYSGPNACQYQLPS